MTDRPFLNYDETHLFLDTEKLREEIVAWSKCGIKPIVFGHDSKIHPAAFSALQRLKNEGWCT